MKNNVRKLGIEELVLSPELMVYSLSRGELIDPILIYTTKSYTLGKASILTHTDQSLY